jgi:hypothetical protein
MMYLAWDESMIPLFVRCLESLPNLHTLETPWADGHFTSTLEDALKRIKLPQIKVLLISPAAHPLLQHCHSVEDLICVDRSRGPDIPSDIILCSLASNRNPKVKRLAIPLALWANPSRK